VYFGARSSWFCRASPSGKARDDRTFPREWLAVLGSWQEHHLSTPTLLFRAHEVQAGGRTVWVSRAHVWLHGGAGISTAAAHSAEQHLSGRRARDAARCSAWQRQQIARLNVISSHLVYH
jgi:hypothetical protein